LKKFPHCLTCLVCHFFSKKNPHSQHHDCEQQKDHCFLDDVYFVPLSLFKMSSLENRSSVNMGDGSSAGTFRTLQRSPIRRMSEETYPALTPQVISHWLSYSHKSIHYNHLQSGGLGPSCELRAGSDRGQSSDVIGTHERFHHINRSFCRDYLFARPRDVLLCASHIHLREQLPRRGLVWRVKSLLSDNCTLFIFNELIWSWYSQQPPICNLWAIFFYSITFIWPESLRLVKFITGAWCDKLSWGV
jgi:hypothetical protein